MQSDRLTPTQWKGYAAAWLGRTFGGLDGFLYSLVPLQFVKDLMVGAPVALVTGPVGADPATAQSEHVPNLWCARAVPDIPGPSDGGLLVQEA